MEELKVQFMQHCWANNQEGVRDCLARGVDVNTLLGEDGFWNGLTIAARNNFPEILEIFLSHPLIKINKTTGEDVTALMVACDAGHSAIVSRLVKVEGIDLNYQSGVDGFTAAHWASFRGETECLKSLAETGKVEWNRRDNSGKTPLFWALLRGKSEAVDVIIRQPNIDYNVKTEHGSTLAQAVVMGGDEKCVERLANQDRCNVWNVPDGRGLTPIMTALEEGKTEIVKILLSCPRVDLSCKNKEGWSLLFTAILHEELGLVKMILLKLEKSYSGSSLARIAVEVGEEEDVRLLVQSGSVDWNEQVEDEDPAILWALKNDKFRIVDILMPLNKINLLGDPSADLTINCNSETFRVHKYFLCSKSDVFRAMLNSAFKEAREGEINIREMNSNTFSSLIHFIYTGDLAEDWEDLDIEDMARASDSYDLSGWMDLFCSALGEKDEVSGGKVAEMIIVGSRFKHSTARELRMVAREKIRQRNEITEDPEFRERLRREDDDILFQFIAIMSQ